MNLPPQQILVVVAIILSVIALIRPAWPCLGVAVLLLGIAMLVR